MVAVGTMCPGAGPGRDQGLSVRFQTARIPTARAPPTSSASRSPTITQADGATARRRATSRNTAGCGLAWGNSEV